MAAFLTPLAPKTPGNSNLKVTITSSPVFLPRQSLGGSNNNNSNRTPNKRKNVSGSETGLFLKRVIGCSTTAFDSHPPSRSFAYTAGAAAVLVQLDDNLQITQRFFRARPNAPTWSSPLPQINSTQSNSFIENRNRLSASLKEIGIGISPNIVASLDDSPSSKTWTARERIKAATCVSISPDGKWLAVGETGYNPRVLVFTMSRDVPSDIPVAAMSEHTFGVRDVAFSPCSKYLASIGTLNDGFVYIWSLSSSNKQGMVRLHSSNKCTSLIRGMAWMGKNLVTVGTRHVKIWRTEDEPRPHSPCPKVLQGRNVILGPMADSVMSCVVGISEDKALVCSERGDICLLDEKGLRLSKVANAEFGINCITVDAESKFAWVAGKHGHIRALVLKEIVPSTPPISPSSSRSGSPVLPYGCRPANVMAMASMLGHLFTIDSNHSIKIINMSMIDGVPVPNTMVRELPAHRDSVLGVRLLPPSFPSGAAFFTWSAGGLVLFWNLEGLNLGEFQVELEQPGEGEDDIANELKAVRVSESGEYFVTGDKYGVLRVIDGETFVCLHAVKAHSGDILDIAVHQHEKTNTVVSCARDRTVQVFQRVGETWTLAQTLDDHTASVLKVLLLENGTRLLSCSTDRTVVLRELVQRAVDGVVSSAYLSLRTITFKSSPMHMTPVSGFLPHLVVSTADRQIHKFDLNTGKNLHSFRAQDESGDAVVIDAISLTKERPGGRPRMLVGNSTTDKSIRVYDMNGNLIDKEWGHTEGVSDVAVLETGSEENDSDALFVISTGTDGTIMIWEYNPRSVDLSSSDSSLSTPNIDSMASKQPIRRILSKTDLVEFTPKPNPDKEVIQGTSSGSNSVNNSPPRTVKKRASAIGLNKSLVYGKPGMTLARTDSGESSTPSTPVFGNELNPHSNVNGRESRRGIRERSQSPPDVKTPTPVGYSSRRPSNESRKRGKSVGGGSDHSNVNALAEDLLKSLRTFRKRLDGNPQHQVRPETLRELEKEIGIMNRELSDKERKKTRARGTLNGTPNDALMMQMLDQYSERLMSMVTSKLDQQLNKEADSSKQEVIEDAKKCGELTGEG